MTNQNYNRVIIVKLKRTLWGSWTQKPFCVPCFLFLGNRLQPPWPSLSPKWQVQTVANQGREGMQRQGRSGQETIAPPWERVLVPPQGIHRTISLGFPGGTVVKNPPANAGDMSSSPGPGRSHMPQSSKPVRHNY